MPRKGQKTLVLISEFKEEIDKLYIKNKLKLKRMGITSKQGFVLYAIRDYVERRLENGGKQ